MEPSKTKTGDAMRKLIRNLERNDVYDSDDEKNPYASSVRDTRSSNFSILLIIVNRRKKRKKNSQ
jgi:hypothetical protein